MVKVGALGGGARGGWWWWWCRRWGEEELSVFLSCELGEERATSNECERLNPAVAVTAGKSEGRLDPLIASPHVPNPPQAAR